MWNKQRDTESRRYCGTHDLTMHDDYYGIANEDVVMGDFGDHKFPNILAWHEGDPPFDKHKTMSYIK